MLAIHTFLPRAALLLCVALLVKYLIRESYLASAPMEKHAGRLKIHSDRAAMQKLAGPSWSAGAAQGTGMERDMEAEGIGWEKEKWARRGRQQKDR